MSVQFDIDTQETLAQLTKLGSQADWETVVMAGGLAFADEIRAGGEPWLTGNLLNSYDVTGTGKDSEGVYAIMGTNVEYGPYQEFIYTPHVRPAQVRGADKISADMATAAGHLVERLAR